MTFRTCMPRTAGSTVRAIAAAALAAWLGGAAPTWAIDFARLRDQMVDQEIVAAGIKDPRVIQSMRETPRHEFVALAQRANAYYDMALAIGNAQTISPPFVVAYMTEQIQPQPTDKVLEHLSVDLPRPGKGHTVLVEIIHRLLVDPRDDDVIPRWPAAQSDEIAGVERQELETSHGAGRQQRGDAEVRRCGHARRHAAGLENRCETQRGSARCPWDPPGERHAAPTALQHVAKVVRL